MDIVSSEEDREKIEKALEAFAKRRLPLVPITKFRVETDVDVVGDPVLLVRFAFDSPEGQLHEDAIYYGFLTALHDEARDVMGYPG